LTGVVFFDLDGTLTDPKAGIVGSIRFALDRLGLECPEEDNLTWCIGPPLLDSFSKLVGETLAPEALRHYRERFDERGWRENEPYEGIVAALDQLVSRRFTLYVATSKPRVFADRIVEHFALDKYFSEVFGAELDGVRSDKTDLLRFALAKTRPASIPIMVGDRMHDVVGAKRGQSVSHTVMEAAVSWSRPGSMPARIARPRSFLALNMCLGSVDSL
jgi:phosphoglycolate phosphatase